MKFNEIEVGGIYQRGDEQREVLELTRNGKWVKFKPVSDDMAGVGGMSIRGFASWAQKRVEEPKTKMNREITAEFVKTDERHPIPEVELEDEAHLDEAPEQDSPEEISALHGGPPVEEPTDGPKEAVEDEPEDVPMGTSCDQYCVCNKHVILAPMGDAPICSDCEDPKHEFEINGLSFSCVYVGKDENGHLVQLKDGLPHLAAERLSDVKCYGETFHDALDQMEAHVGQIVIDIQRAMRKEARALARKEARQNPN